MSWSPAIGTRALVTRLGHGEALAALIELLSGEVSGEDLVWSNRRLVLLDIGGGHARRLMEDGTGRRLVYWPRVWAARSMAYLNDDGSADALVNGISDKQWRVRMTCIQSLGRIGVMGLTSDLVAGLDDEHPRVRNATVLALGRVGDGAVVLQLARFLDADPKNRRIESAIASIEERESD